MIYIYIYIYIYNDTYVYPPRAESLTTARIEKRGASKTALPLILPWGSSNYWAAVRGFTLNYYSMDMSEITWVLD